MNATPTPLDQAKMFLGLASIGTRLYDIDDDPPEGSIADAERYVWARAFIPNWRRLPDEGREQLRRDLSGFEEEFGRAVADAERREPKSVLDMTFTEARAHGDRITMCDESTAA